MGIWDERVLFDGNGYEVFKLLVWIYGQKVSEHERHHVH